MIVPDALVWITILLLAILFTDMAWDHPQLFDEAGNPIGYAHILTWIRAWAFMFLAGMMWLVMAFYSVTLNNCSGLFAACYTSPTYANTGAALGDYLGTSLIPLFLGLFFLHLAVGIVMLVYLVLPIERRPGWAKGFLNFDKS